MIEEDYVSFEVAKLLKEKGFEGQCHFTRRETETTYGEPWNATYEKDIPIPTLQMVMKWLRKTHQIFIRISTDFLYPLKYYGEIFCYGDNLKTQQDVSTKKFESPEEACEAAIKYCLENLI